MNQNTDQRFVQLKTWVARQLDQAEQPLSVVSGDASFRRYFRAVELSSGRSLIAVDSPPDKEPIEAFLVTSALLQSAGLLVPHVIASDPTLGFMLLSDLGDQLYLPALSADSADELYQRAMLALVELQGQLDPQNTSLPPYNAERLRAEMDLFKDWFLERHLGLTLTTEDLSVIEQLFAKLIQQVSSQNQVIVHRDFHSRNLMIVDGDERPGVIDFQDAVVGPYTYDLVSLLKDCYIYWPREQQLSWVAFYHQAAGQRGIAVPELSKVIKDYDYMGLQRHIKVAGIFCRLNYRDGKANYLQDIPLTLGYIYQALTLIPELNEAKDWFESQLLPVFERQKQPWTALS